MDEYHRVSDQAMDNLLESLESLVDSFDSDHYEVEYHVRQVRFQMVPFWLSQPLQSGVLTLKLGDKGTYVLNKQPPNKQIWLSSPVTCVLSPHLWFLLG